MKIVNSLVENCFAAIQLLAEDAKSMELQDVAGKLGIPKGAADRLLSSLSSVGWVERDPENNAYRLTLRLAIVGQRFLIASNVQDICQPVLGRLAGETGEFVRLAVLEGDGLTWIGQAQGARTGLTYQPPMVAKVPLHVTANGKAWLATLPVERAMKLVLAEGFGKPAEFGPNAIRSVDALLRELSATNEKGFGLALEEAEPGVVAVATVIRAAEGDVVGTISVAGPVIRMTQERIPTLVSLLRSAARDIAMLWPLRKLRQQLGPIPSAPSPVRDLA